MKPITTLLEEIRERADKATPGPWDLVWDEPGSYNGFHGIYTYRTNEDGTLKAQAPFFNDWPGQVNPNSPMQQLTDGGFEEILTELDKSNFDFIAAARQDVPDLVKALSIAVEALEDFRPARIASAGQKTTICMECNRFDHEQCMDTCQNTLVNEALSQIQTILGGGE